MELEFHQCPGCTLSVDETPFCPVAFNLGRVLVPFKEDRPDRRITTVVTFREKQIGKQCELKEGLNSLAGLIMATSGCPMLDVFRPMAYIHQPFASMEETFFRAISGYMVAQFVRSAHGKEPVLHLDGLTKIYGNISQLNRAFKQRLAEFHGVKENVSELVLLEMFAKIGAMTIDDDWLERIYPLFYRYMDPEFDPK